MIITLPDALREGLEARAKALGYESVDELVEDAVHAELFVGGVHDQEVEKRLTELIEEGLASGPAVPVTPEFWEKLQARVDGRLDTEVVLE